MTDADKALEILRLIRDFADTHEDAYVTFLHDWGGNSLTISMHNRGHTHAGIPGGTESQLIDDIYNQFTRGRGLSWCKTEGE